MIERGQCVLVIIVRVNMQNVMSSVCGYMLLVLQLSVLLTDRMRISVSVGSFVVAAESELTGMLLAQRVRSP